MEDWWICAYIYLSLAALFYALVQGFLNVLMEETPKYVDFLARDTLSN